MFTPYNPNPRGINTGDCVIRAICKAMDKTWEKYLKENGFVKELLPNTCPDCYAII